MASDIFLKIGDIKGESNDDRHREQIVGLEWSWGASAQLVPNQGGGAGVGKTSFRDLSFTHLYDKASPLLMKACATGQHMPEATLTARRRGQGQQDFLIIKMMDVIVTSVAPSAEAETSIREIVTLRFAKVDLSYSAQKGDGSLDTPTQFRYDINANKPL